MDESTPNQPGDASPPNPPTVTPVAPPAPVAATEPVVTAPVAPESSQGPLVYPQMDQIDQIASGQEQALEEAEESQNWVKTLLFGFINWAVIPLAIVLILHNFVFQAFHVIGSSMVPTLHETDYLIVTKVGSTESEIERAFGKSALYIPKRYEIIVFHYPKDPTLVFVKRVIGLPGERVVVSGGVVSVYNKQFPNGFNPDTGTIRTQYPTLGDIDEIVPIDSIFVLGDNRTPNGSYDSRDWGTLPSSYIIGNAVIRLLPVDKAGIL